MSMDDGIRIFLRPMEMKGDSTIPKYLQARRVGSGGGTTTTMTNTTTAATGPAIETCLAIHIKDSPLFSRVHLPAMAEYSIHYRTGRWIYESAATPVEEQELPPTHIYIDGYQSLNFCWIGTTAWFPPQSKSAFCILSRYKQPLHIGLFPRAFRPMDASRSI